MPVAQGTGVSGCRHGGSGSHGAISGRCRRMDRSGGWDQGPDEASQRPRRVQAEQERLFQKQPADGGASGQASGHSGPALTESARGIALVHKRSASASESLRVRDAGRRCPSPPATSSGNGLDRTSTLPGDQAREHGEMARCHPVLAGCADRHDLNVGTAPWLGPDRGVSSGSGKPYARRHTGIIHIELSSGGTRSRGR